MLSKGLHYGTRQVTVQRNSTEKESQKKLIENILLYESTTLRNKCFYGSETLRRIQRRTSPPYMFRQLKTLYNACSVLRQRLVTVLNRVTSSTLNPQRRSRQSAGQHQQLHGGQKAVCIGSERTYSSTARSNGAADGEEPASRFLREPT